LACWQRPSAFITLLGRRLAEEQGGAHAVLEGLGAGASDVLVNEMVQARKIRAHEQHAEPGMLDLLRQAELSGQGFPLLSILDEVFGQVGLVAKVEVEASRIAVGEIADRYPLR